MTSLGTRSRLAALVAVLAATAAAGCSSADKKASADAPHSTSKSPVACGLGNGKKATGAPIVVGAVTGKTGPEDFSSAPSGAKAFFNCVNANGGINGRPIKYLVKDDQWNPDQSSAQAHALVQDNGAVAMVGSASFVDCGVNDDYYATQGVVSIPAVATGRACYYGKTTRPFDAGPRISSLGAAQYAAAQGAKSITCVGINVPDVGGWVCGGIKAWGDANGIKVTTVLNAPDGTDVPTVIQKVAGYHPDAAVVVAPVALMTAILNGAVKSGSHVKWYAPASAYTPGLPGLVDRSYRGHLGVSIEFSPWTSAGKDTQLWNAVMDGFAGAKDPRDAFSQAGFLSAKLFVDTLLKVKNPASINRDTVRSALLGVSGFTSDMLCGPWSAAKTAPYYGFTTARTVTLDSAGKWAGGTKCAAVQDSAS